MLTPFLFRLFGTVIISGAIFCSKLFAFTPSEDGLYAVFDTSQGEFTARLFFDRVPVTVANFIGLAENSVSRYDSTTGEARREPLYEGVIFHRVIAGFMIQSGSPNGLGNDGPGYIFPDEMRELISHSKAGILSMANSGPNTNGSQFFVTLGATEWLDNHHTVFGEVVEGMDVVNTIGASETDVNDRPLMDVTINRITIQRQGEAANEFKATDYQIAFDVPIQSNISLSNANQATVTFERDPLVDYFRFESRDLSNWEVEKRLLWTDDNPDSIVDSIQLPSDKERPVYYSYGPLLFPFPLVRDPREMNLTLPEDIYGGFFVIMDEQGTGTFSSGFGDGIISYRWYEMGDYEQLNVFFDYTAFEEDFQIQLYFADGTPANGIAKGVITDQFFGNRTVDVPYNLGPVQ